MRSFYRKELRPFAKRPGDDARGGSLKCPQRERLPSYKIGILMKNKIKTTVMARTGEGFVFAKNKGIERASIFRSCNSNGYAVLAALGLDSNNFGRNDFHWCFFGLTSPEMDPSSKLRPRRGITGRESARYSHRSSMKSNFFRARHSAGLR
jgi:hypothetical protein